MLRRTVGLLSSISAVLLFPLAAHAIWTDVAAVVVTGGAIGAATVIAPGAGTAAAAGVACTAEAGYYVIVSICGWGDPPDLVNFGEKANPAFLLATFTPDPYVSPDLNNSIIEFRSTISKVIQDCRGVSQSRDRLAGAQLVGTPTDVANQQAWLLGWYASLHADGLEANAKLSAVMTSMHSECPLVCNYSVSSAEAKQMRDQEAAGVFPAFEQDVLNDWQFMPDEVLWITTAVGSVSDATIDQFCPMTLGTAMDALRFDCNCVPEPSALLALGVGVAGLYGLGRRRRPA